MDKIEDFILKILNEYKLSKEYQEIKTSYNYYKNIHDILKKERMGVGSNGTKVIINNIPNNKIIDNRYSILVDQKKNYLLSRPITVNCEDEQYLEEIKKLFNSKFHKLFKNIGKDALIANMAYIYPYINEKGEFKLKKFDPLEILPIWTDKTHSKLQAFIRFYKTNDYITDKETEIVEYYHINGINTYELDGNKLRLKAEQPYFTIGDTAYTWGRIPLIYFKQDDEEQPLLNRVKSLQDAINTILSRFLDDAEEDSRNTILVLKNLGGIMGTNLQQLRNNINQAGIISMTGDADVDTLEIKIDPSNYETVLKILKKAIIDNGRGIDSDNEIFRSAPNQMAIQSMYTEIELDANEMETEFKSSLEVLLEFYNIANNIENKARVDFIFDRDVLINESATIENAKNSLGILSQETIIANHPWTIDTQSELNRIIEETKKEIDRERDYDELLAE